MEKEDTFVSDMLPSSKEKKKQQNKNIKNWTNTRVIWVITTTENLVTS